jgi:haloalkane dehalogenase
MHYVDEGAGEVILALHGEPSRSYLYRKFIPILSDYRFIAPDLIGFGKSDKITGWRNYTFDLHFKSLVNFISKLDLSDITLVVQDWGGILGLSLLGEYPERFKRVVILNTALPTGEPFPLNVKIWRNVARFHPSLPAGSVLQYGTYTKLNRETTYAYNAPFPSRRFKSGAKAFPLLIPTKPNDDGVPRIVKARKVLSEWTKPALVMFSDKDFIIGYLHDYFHRLIPSFREKGKITIQQAGHFLQEDKGEEIASMIDKFIKE